MKYLNNLLSNLIAVHFKSCHDANFIKQLWSNKLQKYPDGGQSFDKSQEKI